tara:strand:- start:12783 stop:13388 length:606 start_codon:yes stop_codon:yes gene_type:complete
MPLERIALRTESLGHIHHTSVLGSLFQSQGRIVHGPFPQSQVALITFEWLPVEKSQMLLKRMGRGSVSQVMQNKRISKGGCSQALDCNTLSQILNKTFYSTTAAGSKRIPGIEKELIRGSSLGTSAQRIKKYGRKCNRSFFFMPSAAITNIPPSNACIPGINYAKSISTEIHIPYFQCHDLTDLQTGFPEQSQQQLKGMSG